MLQQERIHLAWGTTLIVITSRVDDPLFDEIFRSRRVGLDAMLILVGTVARYEETRRRARHFGIPVHAIQSERDLDLWRQ
jgi:formyltetrahydrofolate hydrolase